MEDICFKVADASGKLNLVLLLRLEVRHSYILCWYSWDRAQVCPQLWRKKNPTQTLGSQFAFFFLLIQHRGKGHTPKRCHGVGGWRTAHPCSAGAWQAASTLAAREPSPRLLPCHLHFSECRKPIRSFRYSPKVWILQAVWWANPKRFAVRVCYQIGDLTCFWSHLFTNKLQWSEIISNKVNCFNWSELLYNAGTSFLYNCTFQRTEIAN